jgi:non-specific serine/threonine protein kinase
MESALGRLPGEKNSFVGRQEELHALDGLLGGARLVTITGPGGVGKTRVCLRSAARVADRYPDGSYLAGLSGLRDPALLPLTVAGSLGLQPPACDQPLAVTIDYLCRRRLLLILDTCEHLLDACAEFAETIMREAPDVTLLATSRQPLDVPGEHLYPLRPLPRPEAEVLFAQRAADVVPEFTRGPRRRDDVTSICQRLDGMPLAIELTAAALGTLSLPELASQVSACFQVLDMAGPEPTGRHHTLRTAIEWSYDLCSPAERALWRKLSVFAGTFTLRAAEDVCGETASARESAVLTALIGLVDKSVILRGESDEYAYRMLDTIREFGAAKLASSGQEARFRGRHLERYLRMARYFGDHLADDDQCARFHELRGEHGDIQAALKYALASPPGVTADLERGAADLATALYGYWQISGPGEGAYWLAKVLERFPGPSPRRARILITSAYLDAARGAGADGMAAGTEGLRIARELGDEPLIARGLLYLGSAQTAGGMYAEAAAAYAEAGRRLEALGDHVGQHILDINQAYLAQLSMDVAGALRFSREGLRRFGDDSRELWLHGYLNAIAGLGYFLEPGREAECASATVTALHAKYELGDTLGIAYALGGFACLAGRANRHGRAAWLLGAIDLLWERAAGSFGGVAIVKQLYEQVSDRAREALGDRPYDALHLAGSRASLDQVIARATADADRLTAPPPAAHRPAGRLTRRERQVAALAANGLRNVEISEQLHIAARTVESHLWHVYAKLEVSSRNELPEALGGPRGQDAGSSRIGPI